jgi:hypothetical protein
MKLTHTPGPWLNDGDLVDTQDGVISCDTGPKSEANARLIASAPELLAACLSALRALEDNTSPGPMDGDAKAGLRAAIATATNVPVNS